MSVEFSLLQRVTAGGRNLEKILALNNEGLKTLDVDIADSETDKLVNFTLDVSQCRGIMIVADGDITLETNSGSSPGNTISLVADIPYVWHSQAYHAFLLTTDVTALYFTNASGASVNVRIECIEDATP